MPRPRLALLLCAGVLALVVGAVALSWPGAQRSDGLASAAAAPVPADAGADPNAAEVPDPEPAAAPARRPTPTLAEPVAGQSAEDAAAPAAGRPAEVVEDLSVPSEPEEPALEGERRARRGAEDAEVLPNGIALPPVDAPDEVGAIIAAGNEIARTPYLWGGGHGRWLDRGYDCSGSVSYALASAGLLNAPLASGPFMRWGSPGKGKWVTIYANEGHMFLEVAGVRFDTSGRSRTGSRWQSGRRPTSGYVARHPRGL